MALDILIVDDEADIGRLIAETLQDEGFTTRQALDGMAALEAVRARRPSLVILDIWLGDSRMDGIKVLELILKDYADLPVIMMSGHGTIETAVKSIQKGAYDFIEKPFKADRLMVVLKRALEASALRRENLELKERQVLVNTFIGKSSAIQTLRQQIERVAPTSSRVMITGGPGTGKEMAAKMIHQQSKRAHGPFVTLNCATLHPDHLESELFGSESATEIHTGILERAHQGTLFLDEVTDMPLETQKKIVRLLQEQHFERVGGTRKVVVDVRVLSSASRDMKVAIENGSFREDLYYRLNVVPLHVPTLKERRDDVAPLVRELSTQIAKANNLPQKEFAHDAMVALQAYDWPGNVRQLKNIIEWVLIMASESNSQEITASALPAEVLGENPALIKQNQGADVMALSLRAAREAFEKNYLLAQVARFSGNIAQTANFIGMERAALHRKLKALQLKDHRTPETPQNENKEDACGLLSAAQDK